MRVVLSRVLPSLWWGVLLGFLSIGTSHGQPQVVAQGNYPDIASDTDGNIHLVYGRDGELFYRFYSAAQGEWSEEERTPLARSEKAWDLHRADPDIVVDSEGRPHVHAWDGYAFREGDEWKAVPLLPNEVTRYRDSEMAIDSADTIYLTRRGGFNGGDLGIQKRRADAAVFEPVSDPDLGLTSDEISNHVYPDIAISPVDDSIHVIQRHGPNRTTAYRRSRDGGKTWDLRNTVSAKEPEAPHIAVDSKGRALAVNGSGEFFRLEGDEWIAEGRPVRAGNRDQPELSVDASDAIYLAAFGGKFNVRAGGSWLGEREISSVTGEPIGFVETAGGKSFAYAVWEEGNAVHNHDLVSQPARIVVGRILEDGEVVGLDGSETEAREKPLSVQRFGCYEATVRNAKPYRDPFRDVTLQVTMNTPTGETLEFEGFYNGERTWMIRFRPDVAGDYTYRTSFSDGAPGTAGRFRVREESDLRGPIKVNPANPIWFSRGNEPFQVRAFHVGDRFFASNWSGEERQAFLDWCQAQGYNTLSIASHLLNRDEEERGRSWKTPDLWPLNTAEYARMESILDELNERGMVVFPFAGFFGKNSDYPRHPEDQDLYLRYTMARIGHYPNLLYNVAGPEPNLRDQWMPSEEVERLGRRIRDLDLYDHPLTVHNRTGDDPYRDSDWTTFGTLQGPKTVDRARLSAGLLESHHPAKPLFAQETLWSGNMYHVERRIGRDYSDDDLRKNAFVIKMSGASFCFADNQGNSSSGFSGSLDLTDCAQSRHDVIKRVWDFFDSMPYHEMVPRQDLVDGGYCLARPGERYLVYLESGGQVRVDIDGGPYHITWINGAQTADQRSGGMLFEAGSLTSPGDGEDWLLHLWRKE